MRFLVPLGVFALLVVLLGVGLTLNPREVPSPLIDKPAPAFQLPRLDRPDQSLSRKDMLGKVWLLNVWASWCVACREEHPVLVEFSKKGIVPIIGLNYKDRAEAGKEWLKRYGDPYVLSVTDADGSVGINYGVYGVPETFLIDRQGTIRYKQIGPVTPKSLDETILPMIRTLQNP